MSDVEIWISALEWVLLHVVAFVYLADRGKLLSIKKKKKLQLSQKKLRQNSSKKQNGRSCFGHYSQSGFNWLARMEKWCLRIIISVVFLNSKLSDYFFFPPLLMWPMA